MTSFKINLPGRTCSYEIGAGLVTSLRKRINQHLGRGRLFVVYDANFYALHGQRLSRALRIPPERLSEFVLPSGEKGKSRRVLSGLQDFMLRQRIRRSDLVLACGGGVTTDISGFAAATVLRGVRWAALPTTLLAMVDAAIGGKTGINHATGKNLIGAFWQPVFVSADITYLHTLPDREMLAGLGEVVKAAGLGGGEFLLVLKDYLKVDELLNHKRLCDIVTRAARFKAKIVAADEREAGRRRVLNFGHTFGHAIENSLGYRRLLHGEAVLIGIMAALELGKQLGFDSKGLNDYQLMVGDFVSLVPRVKIDREQVIEAMMTDKKVTRDGLNFVLLRSIGRPIVTAEVTKAQIRSALNRTIAFCNG